MWVLVEEMDSLKEGDEFFAPVRNTWEPIPKNWVGTICKYDSSSTFGRFNIPVRRKISDDLIAAEVLIAKEKIIDDIKKTVRSWFLEGEILSHQECDILNSIVKCYRTE